MSSATSAVPTKKVVVTLLMLLLPPRRFSAVPSYSHAARLFAPAPLPRMVWLAPVRVHPPALRPETSFDTACSSGPRSRERIAERCAALDQSNGAVELASFIEEMAYSRRVDRP